MKQHLPKLRWLMLSVILLVYVLTAYSLAAQFSPDATWDTGQFVPVESSVFDAARYEPKEHVLTLVFRSGDVYAYYGVSRKTWLTFMRVQYKGSFFNAHIRRSYDYRFVGRAP